MMWPVIAIVGLLWALPGQAQQATSGSANNMPYQLVVPAAGCSTSAPCSVVEYLHWLGASQQDITKDLQNFFGPAWQAAHPKTIVVAPFLANSSTTNNWGGKQAGVSAGLSSAVAVLKQVQSQYPTITTSVVVTGGSMGAMGTSSALVQYGPKGLTGQHIFAAGLAYDGGDQVDSSAVLKQTLCGVPLTVQHGSADANVPVSYDRNLAQTLNGCPGFKYIEIAGAGHGTWGESYTSGSDLAGVMAQAAGSAPAIPLSPDVVTAKIASIAAAERAAAPTTKAVCDASSLSGTLLPCGQFHVVGSQILSQDNVPVRLTCTAWWGSLPDWDLQMATIALSGFNCLRISYFNRHMDTDLDLIDKTIAAAAKQNIRIIVNNHANEGMAGGCNAQQANGLWYDLGGASDGTDGCGTPGTVDDARWVADWQKVAKRYAGNQTIIGYDLWNEPTDYGKGSCWGCPDPNRDIRAAYQRAGNAILAIDPDKLIIVEGSQDYGTNAPQGDLRPAKTAPVVLNVPGRVVYSVHEYPATIAGTKPNDGSPYIANMKEIWGWMYDEDFAPVWIGELGASMNNDGERKWAADVVAFANGVAVGGMRIPKGGQGPGIDWWMWDELSGGMPDGALQPDKITPKPEQQAVYMQLIQRDLGAMASPAATMQKPGTTAAPFYPVAVGTSAAAPTVVPTTTPVAVKTYAPTTAGAASTNQFTPPATVVQPTFQAAAMQPAAAQPTATQRAYAASASASPAIVPRSSSGPRTAVSQPSGNRQADDTDTATDALSKANREDRRKKHKGGHHHYFHDDD